MRVLLLAQTVSIFTHTVVNLCLLKHMHPEISASDGLVELGPATGVRYMSWQNTSVNSLSPPNRVSTAVQLSASTRTDIVELHKLQTCVCTLHVNSIIITLLSLTM